MKLKKTWNVALAVALAASLGAPSAEAGLMGKFKELLDKTGTAMENYNGNMWTNEDSLGNTAIKSVKDAVKQKGIKGKAKGLTDAFDKVVAAQVKAQDTALTDVKAVLKVLADIVLWLPRKLQELFKKAMDKVRAFMAKLGQMNQGATVKERWGNLVGAGAGGGGGAAAFEMPADDELADAVADEPAEAEEGDSEEAAASLDARASASLPELDGAFTAMVSSVRKLEGDQRKTSVKAVQSTFLACAKLCFERDSQEGAEILWKEAPSVFRTNPDGMQRALEDLAQGYDTSLAKSLVKASGRLAKSIKVSARVQ